MAAPDLQIFRTTPAMDEPYLRVLYSTPTRQYEIRYRGGTGYATGEVFTLPGLVRMGSFESWRSAEEKDFNVRLTPRKGYTLPAGLQSYLHCYLRSRPR